MTQSPAEEIANASWSEIKEQAKVRGLLIGGPEWQDFIGRLIHENNPFV